MNKNYPYLGFNDWPYVLVGLPFISFLIPQLFFQLTPWNDWDIFPTEWLEASIFTVAFWLTFRSVMIYLRKRYPHFQQAKMRVRATILIYLLAVPVINFLLTGLIQICQLTDGQDHYDPGLYKGFLTTYFISFAIIACYEAIYFYAQLRTSISEKEEAKQAHIRSELEGLRNQVNPHFLFNSLNTLMHIVGEDPKLARRFLQRLSKVYRYILESRNEPLIPLEQELDFIHSYIFLQEERFRGNLKVEMKVDPLFHPYQIVPLSLQILFENAIKHNVISRQNPLRIEVYINQDLQLVVSNNLQRKNQVIHSTRVGLENISKRYRYFTDQEIDVREDETEFTVAIPLIHPNKSSVYASADH